MFAMVWVLLYEASDLRQVRPKRGYSLKEVDWRHEYGLCQGRIQRPAVAHSAGERCKLQPAAAAFID
jgi:hypothetical protein